MSSSDSTETRRAATRRQAPPRPGTAPAAHAATGPTPQGDLRSPPAIRTRGLTRDFPEVRAVDQLSLEVPRGTVFGFLGRNGAGKTTTIRLLLGLLDPTAGRARVLGFDCAAQSSEVRKRCGVLLENSGLIERLSAADNLEIYGRIWRVPREVRRLRIRELLERVGLWERRDDRVRTWSRGMKQKLAIARALLHRPAVLFLDEPTAGLDPVAAASLREDLIAHASRERVTVFLNTHNLAEAERMCDRVAVIRDGRLLALGTPAELRARIARQRVEFSGSGFTQSLIDLLRSRAEIAWATRENGRLVVDVTGGAPVAPLVRLLVRVGADVEEVSRVGNSLEDAFHSLLRGDVPPSGSWLVSRED